MVLKRLAESAFCEMVRQVESLATHSEQNVDKKIRDRIFFITCWRAADMTFSHTKRSKSYQDLCKRDILIGVTV